MRKRILPIGAALSALVLVALILLGVGSRHTNGFTGDFRLTKHFHLGVLDGGLWFHSHSLPYRGSIIEVVMPGVPSAQIRGFDFPGIYYRFIRLPTDPEPLWTLRLSLAFPIMLSLIFPLLWFLRSRRPDNEPRQPTPGVHLACISTSLARRGCALRWASCE